MDYLEMSRTTPPLKWLAERRARTAGSLAKAERQASRLEELVAVANNRAAAAADAAESVHRLRADLTSLDRTLALHTPGVDASAVAPVHAWQGRYGERGALRGSLIDLLKARSPEWSTTQELAVATVVGLNLNIEVADERRRWICNSLRGALKVLAAQGLVESMHDPRRAQMRCLWRWKLAAHITLASLHTAVVH